MFQLNQEEYDRDSVLWNNDIDLNAYWLNFTRFQVKTIKSVVDILLIIQFITWEPITQFRGVQNSLQL